MKSTAKFFSILLAAALMLSVGLCPAYADDDPTGSITIKNPTPQNNYYHSVNDHGYSAGLYHSYVFFRILDLTGRDTSDPADGTYDAVSYTIAEKWEGFFTPAEDPSDNPAGVGYLIAEEDATAEQKAGLNQILINGAVYYLNLTESNVAEFANAATKYALMRQKQSGVGSFSDGGVSPPDISLSGAGEPITVEGLPLGYYLVVPEEYFGATFSTDMNEFSSGSIASLTSTVPNATVKIKAARPSIEKTDDAVSADIGQVVHYTITGKVPNTLGYENYVYQIMDSMSYGLTFQNDISVTITYPDPETGEPASLQVEDFVQEALQSGTNYSDHGSWYGLYGDNGFKVNIPVNNYQEYIGCTITLSYTAIVNENALAANEDTYWGEGEHHETNYTMLRYGHNPGEYSHGSILGEEVYTASIYIYKHTGEGDGWEYISRAEYEALDETERAVYRPVWNPDPGREYMKPVDTASTPLAGAKFVLMNSEGKYLKYTFNGTKEVYDNELQDYIEVPVLESVSWVAVPDAPTPTTTVVTDAMIGALADAAEAGSITAVVSDEQGMTAFTGIHDDIYRVVEIEAPAGFNRLTAPQEVTVQGEDGDVSTDYPGKQENVADYYGRYSMDSSSDAFSSVLNQSGAVLPDTGGIGTTLFYVVGGVLILAAAVLLITKKRMNRE